MVNIESLKKLLKQQTKIKRGSHDVTFFFFFFFRYKSFFWNVGASIQKLFGKANSIIIKKKSGIFQIGYNAKSNCFFSIITKVICKQANQTD